MGKVLALVGSPRREGNSEILAREFLNGVGPAADSEVLRLNSLRIRPCQACDACAGSGRCVMRDDMQDVYPKIEAAAGILLVTPIYFGGVSGQVKVFMDRFQCWWHAKYTFKQPFVNKEEMRPAFLITVGAWDKAEYVQGAVAVTKVFFTVTNYHLQGVLNYTGYDQPGSIAQREVLAEVRAAGSRFADSIVGK